MPTIDSDFLITLLGLLVIAAPLVLTAALGVTSLLGGKLQEPTTNKAVQLTNWVGLVASLAVLALMLILGTRYVPIDLGDWIVLPDHEHHSIFAVKFVFDRLSVPFVILSFALCGTIGAFASRYVHREPGFDRFFMLYAVFVLGMVMTSLAGTVEVLFAGWELVGLSSALLVAFFQERPMPVRNGLRVWVVYRVADAAFLMAAVMMHHYAHVGDFARAFGEESPWPLGQTSLTEGQALLIGLLLLVAAAGKSALVPFSGWLPRAMEGPTPSSAVFYGALSVHLGAFLLLRFSPVLEASVWLQAAVVFLGLTTALYAYIAGGVQTDIKGALSFASLVQVGLIVAEIGVGLRYIALTHILGHACLRTLQFVRAPTLLQDYRTLENAIGARLSHPRGPWQRLLSPRARAWLYRLGLERGCLDAWLSDYVVAPFVRLFRRCDGMERKWTDLLSGTASRESGEVKQHPELIEEQL